LFLFLELLMNPAIRTVLVVVLVLLLLGMLPVWPYAGWGYYPSGGLGLLLIVVLVLIFARKL
jgi:hypothetical protein